MRTKFVWFQLAWRGAVIKISRQKSSPNIFRFAVLANQTNMFIFYDLPPIQILL